MKLKRKILTSYEDKRVNLIVIITLIVSILVTNSFIIFSPDEKSRFYFSNLTSTLTVGAAFSLAHERHIPSALFLIAFISLVFGFLYRKVRIAPPAVKLSSGLTS